MIAARELRKTYGSNSVIDGVSLELGAGQCLALLGPNGAGKTTLLRVLLGHDDADAGTLRWGANLKIGNYDQRLEDFDPDVTVLEEVAEGRMGEREQALRDVLATMLFRGDDIYKPLGLLSGGERARVRLAQLLIDRPNVLVLDEPTNHLDIPSREALESTLAGFDGTILCVSHDRFFLDRVVNRLLVLRPPTIDDFALNYSGWVRKLAADSAAAKEAAAAAASRSKSRPEPPRPAPRDSAKRKDNPYARPFGRLTLEELEREITDTEVAIAECQEGFGDAESFKDPSRAQRLQDEYKELSKKLEGLEAEYFAREK